MAEETQRIASIKIDDRGVAYKNPFIEREKQLAMEDLIHKNYFSLKNGIVGPYNIFIKMSDDYVIFEIKSDEKKNDANIAISLLGYMKIIKDYFQLCENYYSNIPYLPPEKIEALDMGRRSIHNEAAGMLVKSMDPWVKIDHLTARQLFTLICVLLSKV